MRQRFVRQYPAPRPFVVPSALPGRIFVSALRVERRRTIEGHTVLRLAGELESATVPAFRQAVAEIGPGQRVILDMAEVPFVDSCGIGALIGAVRRVRELGGAITLAAVCHPVHRVLSLTGVQRIVELSETVDEARAHLSGVEGRSPADGDPMIGVGASRSTG